MTFIPSAKPPCLSSSWGVNSCSGDLGSKHGQKKKVCPSDAENHQCSCRITLHTQREVGLQSPDLTALGKVELYPGQEASLVMVTEPTTELSIGFLSEEPCEHIKCAANPILPFVACFYSNFRSEIIKQTPRLCMYNGTSIAWSKRGRRFPKCHLASTATAHD